MDVIVERLDEEKMKQGFSTVCFPEGPVYVLYGDASKKFERLHQQNAELVEVLKEIANADMFDDECKPTGGGYLINKARAAIAKATEGEK